MDPLALYAKGGQLRRAANKEDGRIGDGLIGAARVEGLMLVA